MVLPQNYTLFLKFKQGMDGQKLSTLTIVLKITIFSSVQERVQFH